MKRAQTLDQRKWRVLNTQEAVAQVVCHALAGVTSREIRPLACGSDEKTMKIGGDFQRLVPYYLPVANRRPRRLTLPPKWNQLLWHEEFRFGLMPKCFLGCNEPVRSQKQLIQKRQMRAIWWTFLRKVSKRNDSHPSDIRLVTILAGSPPYASSSCTRSIAIVFPEYFRST